MAQEDNIKFQSGLNASRLFENRADPGEWGQPFEQEFPHIRGIAEFVSAVGDTQENAPFDYGAEDWHEFIARKNSGRLCAITKDTFYYSLEVLRPVRMNYDAQFADGTSRKAAFGLAEGGELITAFGRKAGTTSADRQPNRTGPGGPDSGERTRPSWPMTSAAASVVQDRSEPSCVWDGSEQPDRVSRLAP